MIHFSRCILCSYKAATIGQSKSEVAQVKINFSGERTIADGLADRSVHDLADSRLGSQNLNLGAVDSRCHCFDCSIKRVVMQGLKLGILL